MGCASGPSFADSLRVMLQGGSTQDLRKLVESSGGAVTHDLHIIDAVGAKLTRAQLDQVLESPLIRRVIDDLSVSGDTPDALEPDEQECNVGGSLELQFDTRGIRWPIYNKTKTPATLTQLQLSWPEPLGAVSKISIGDAIVDPAKYAGTAGLPVVLEFSPPSAPVLTEQLDLRVSFSNALQDDGGSSPIKQRDFSVKADFGSDCSTKLVPGYENNHEDFFYAHVAGASALHLLGVTGKGVTVAILDSGLWEHDQLALDTHGKPRIIGRYDAITDISGKETFDESGHGTHMASVAANSGPVTHNGEATGTFKGIAPDASLVVVKALDVKGQGDFLDLVRGVQWVVDNRKKYDIRVLNLSIAARPRWPYWQDPLNQAVMRAWASGITVIAAAGNEGPDAMTIGSPGNLPYIITVGAITDSWTLDTRSDDYIPEFSSRGPTPSGHIKPDIVAPGGHITGITRPGSSLTQQHPNFLLSTGEFVMTGSSQAAAVVSGIAALLLQLEPDLSPDDIKCKLVSSAEPAINRDGLLAYSPFQQGQGLVSASRAVTLGQRGCGNSDLDLQLEISRGMHSQGPAMVDEDGSATLPGLKTMLSSEPAEKGMSTSRKWGVKDHIERSENPEETPDTAHKSPFNWPELYLQEKIVIESIHNRKVNQSNGELESD